VTWKSPLSAKILGHFSPIVPPSATRARLWRQLERSNLWGLTCRWQRHFVKRVVLTFWHRNLTFKF
jgi:hypothetical protein